MAEQLTVKEVLEITIRNLEAIQIPVGLTDSVGIPIARNINNLRECIKAMDAAGAPQQEAPGTDTEADDGHAEAE